MKRLVENLPLFEEDTEEAPLPSPPPELTFIDLFAGIGGIRKGLEAAGGRCVYTVESDRFAMQTYSANFPAQGSDPHQETESPRDIRTTEASEIPDYNVLAAGFPCQPFSIAGVSKKNALKMAHGFDDEKSGDLFFHIVRLVEEAKHPPAVLFLENVKNFRTHDQGRTWSTVEGLLDELGYTISAGFVDAKAWVPQHRERIFIVCTRKDLYLGRQFRFPDAPEPAPRPTLDSVLERGPVDDRYTLSDHLWRYLRDYKAKHEAAGNGFGYGLVTGDDISRTLSARYYKDGSEILVAQNGKNPRRLTPRECSRLMGFGDDFFIPVSDTQAYKQFGNAVVVDVIEFLGKSLVEQGFVRPATGTG